MKNRKTVFPACLCVAGITATAMVSVAADLRNGASPATRAANQAVRESLPFENEEDFRLANRGFIAKPESTVIRDATGKVVWDMDQFAFEMGDAPGTANPSLWRQAKLNSIHWLFKVTERIYQVRGFDVSNLSVIEGDTGYIVVDPLITAEVATAAMDLVFAHLPRKPIVAVIYSHSHADHFGGVKGVVNDSDVRAGKVRIVASEGFMEFAVSENILAGNVMTRRLANHGYTMDEISETITLPPELANVWYNRGYYGTVSHNVRAVYQKYLGFFDGNPANMHKLPPVASAQKYVEFMGGADALLEKAQLAYDDAEYRWVAEVVNHLVFADPNNRQARELQASALEQLGYQAESGQWRNFYLTGASELRNGVITAGTTRTASPDMLNALSLDSFFDFLAVKLNGPKAAGKKLTLNFRFTDTGDEYLVTLVNGVLHRDAGAQSANADVTVTLTRAGLAAMAMLGRPVATLLDNAVIQADGDVEALEDLVSLLDNFEFWFDIVTP